MNVGLGLLADRYEIGELVGQGRSAVYRARDSRLGREVAVKRVLVAPGRDDAGTTGETAEDVRIRACREARAAARVVSPHAVGIYDVVEEGDAVWLVMELVPAPSLERLVADCGPLDEARAARIALDVLEALTAAHAQGIVHRDVKPANVLVGTPVKLADFGIAALRDESGLTMPGLVVGSPSYMAPEQASAGEVGPAADLWALGALLYFAVEGEPPFAAGSALATATAVVHSPFRPQRRPGRLSPVIGGLLAKDAGDRPDAGAVRAALAPVAAGTSPDEPTGAMLAATMLSRDAVTGPGGGDATLTGPGVAPPSGRGRRRSRRLALAAALAVVVAGAAVAAGVVRPGGPADTPPADARPTSPAPGAPALAPGADAGTAGHGKGAARKRPDPTSTTTTAAATPAAKAKDNGKAKGQATTDTTDPGNTATTLGSTPPTTVGETPTTAPPDQGVTEPPAPDPVDTTPTTVAAEAGGPPPDQFASG